MAVPDRDAGRQRDVHRDLQQRHQRIPPELWRHVRPRRIGQPIRPLPRQRRPEPNHRIAGILDVHVPHRAPRPIAIDGAAAPQKSHQPSVAELRRPRRRVRTAIPHQRPPDLARERRPAPHRPFDRILEHGVQVRRTLRTQRPQAQSVQVQPRPVVLRQSLPMFINDVEQRPSRIDRALGIDVQRHPARQIRILRRHDRGIAAVQIFDGVHRRRVQPSGAGRRGDDQHRPVEPAASLEFRQGQFRPPRHRVGRPPPGVHPDRIGRRRAVKLADLRCGRSRGEEHLSLPSDRIPTDPGSIAGERRRFARVAVERRVPPREEPIGGAERGGDHDVVGDERHPGGHQTAGDHHRHPPRHDPIQPPRHAASRPDHAPDDRHHDARHRDGDRQRSHRIRRFDRVDVHQRPDRVLPGGHLRQRRGPQCDGDGRRRDADDREPPIVRLPPTEIAVRPNAGHADAVPHRHRDAGQHALDRRRPRQQRRRHRSRQPDGRHHQPDERKRPFEPEQPIERTGEESMHPAQPNRRTPRRAFGFRPAASSRPGKLDNYLTRR